MRKRKILGVCLDALAVVCLTVGAFEVWPPAAWFVLGGLALLASWRIS